MINYIRNISRITFPIFLLIFSSGIYGQGTPGVLENISSKFQDYCRNFPREEIFIQTDREEYISGENLWFKAYLIDRQTSKLSSGSSIAYFEILNSERRPVVQKRIKLEKGSGPGEIQLPDTLSSGDYLIRAYTSWMKNFLPSNCFMKQIKVYNAVNTLTFRGISDWPDVRTKYMKNNSQTNDQGPGILIRIDKSGTEYYDLIIETGVEFRQKSGSPLYLLIQTHGIINYKGIIVLTENLVKEPVPQSAFIPGINDVVIFDRNSQIVAEKFFYTPSGKTPAVSVSFPESLKTREKVSLDLDVEDGLINDKNPLYCSISVAETADSLQSIIADYLVFGSEFGVLPEMPGDILPEKMSDTTLNNLLPTLKSNWIDWNTILSGNFPDLKYKREATYHYLNGRLIEQEPLADMEGKFLFLSQPGKKASFQYARTDKAGNFSFKLPVNEALKDLIIQPEIITKDISIKLEPSYSEIYPDYSAATIILNSGYNKKISRQGANYQVRKIYDSEIPVLSREQVIFWKDTLRFYGKPDIELIMDDYIKLPVMSEVFFELIPGVFLKKKRSEYEITIADPVDSRVFDKSPLLFVDGVIIHDPAVIADLDPEAVEEVDAIKERYIVGDFLFYGLVNVITRAGDYSKVTLPDYAVRLPYRVVEPVKEFSSPGYSESQKKSSRVPDFRNTLYWNPAVIINKESKTRLEFWTSDFVTDYVINIQGMTRDGRPVSIKKNISVR